MAWRSPPGTHPRKNRSCWSGKRRREGSIGSSSPIRCPRQLVCRSRSRSARPLWGPSSSTPSGTALSTNPTWVGTEEEKLAAYVSAIREIGPEHVVISSDLGQSMNPIHTDGLAVFLAKLRKAGFSQEEVDQMSKANPAWLLGL